MARKLRVEDQGAIYHLMNRGDRREAVFWDNRDRQQFLETLEETCGKTAWQVHAYCLLGNHFHLVMETPRANLCAGMHWLLGTYTARFNRRHRFFGHLFSGRSKSLLVDGSESGSLKSVCDDVHLNPARAKLIGPEQRLREYRWSSYPEYLKAPWKRPKWLRVDRLLGEWGMQRDSVAERRRFEQEMEERKLKERQGENREWRKLRRGWCWGGTAFREELLELIGEVRAEHHDGEELLESAELEAERLIQEMMREVGWTKEQLGTQPKGDKRKVRIAASLRAETTMSWKWIAEKLHMGHWRTAANAVRAGL